MQVIGWPIIGLLFVVFVVVFNRKNKDRHYVYFLCVMYFILLTAIGLGLARASTGMYYPVEHVLAETRELAPFQVVGAKHLVYLEQVEIWNPFGATKYLYSEVSVSRTSSSPQSLVTAGEVYVSEFLEPNRLPVMEKWQLRYNCSKFLGPSWIYSFTFCPENALWEDRYEFKIPAETFLRLP